MLEAYLFGSCARGDAGSASDVDVAVYLDSKLVHDPAGYAAALATELIAALHENRIDLVVLDSAPPVLYHRVLRDGIRLHARDLQATTVREGRAYSRYPRHSCPSSGGSTARTPRASPAGSSAG